MNTAQTGRTHDLHPTARRKPKKSLDPWAPSTQVALANKMARIAWAVLAKGETYRTPTRSSSAAIAAAA